MRIWTIILSVVFICGSTACAENTSHLTAYDTPQKVNITPEDHSRYESLPSELREILESLTFADPELNKKVIGDAPEQKIKSYNVKAYVDYGDGWLVASGYGEWGGVVFWIDKDGDYEIIRDDDLAYPIDAIVENDRVFIAQGMSHLVISDGHILEVIRENEVFETRAYPINSYPGNFEKNDGIWIIPTASRQFYFILSELRAGKSILHKRD